MPRLIPLLAVLACNAPAPVLAQDYLSQQEVAEILSENAFCYDLLQDGACGWAEVYEAPAEIQFRVYIGSIFGSGELAVIEQEATWINDAMCIRDNDYGIVGLTQGPAPFYFFDRRGQIPHDPGVMEALIEFLAEDLQPKTCFRFARDPSRPNGLEQHVYSDGDRLPGADPIDLVPLSQGSVQLRGN